MYCFWWHLSRPGFNRESNSRLLHTRFSSSPALVCFPLFSVYKSPDFIFHLDISQAVADSCSPLPPDPKLLCPFHPSLCCPEASGAGARLTVERSWEGLHSWLSASCSVGGHAFPFERQVGRVCSNLLLEEIGDHNTWHGLNVQYYYRQRVFSTDSSPFPTGSIAGWIKQENLLTPIFWFCSTYEVILGTGSQKGHSHVKHVLKQMPIQELAYLIFIIMFFMLLYWSYSSCTVSPAVWKLQWENMFLPSQNSKFSRWVWKSFLSEMLEEKIVKRKNPLNLIVLSLYCYYLLFGPKDSF